MPPPRQRRPDAPATVSARFNDVATASAFFKQMGMPTSLLNQLSGWIEGLVPGEVEEMRPELTWGERPTTLSMIATVDDEGEALDVEFRGLADLIVAVEAELDAFFRRRPPGAAKDSGR